MSNFKKYILALIIAFVITIPIASIILTIVFDTVIFLIISTVIYLIVMTLVIKGFNYDKDQCPMVKRYHKLLITANYKFNSCSDNTMLLSLMDMTPDYESGDKGSIPLGAIYWDIDKFR